MTQQACFAQAFHYFLLAVLLFMLAMVSLFILPYYLAQAQMVTWQDQLAALPKEGQDVFYRKCRNKSVIEMVVLFAACLLMSVYATDKKQQMLEEGDAIVRLESYHEHCEAQRVNHASRNARACSW